MHSTTSHPSLVNTMSSMTTLLMNNTLEEKEESVEMIKYVAYSIVAYMVVVVGMMGNLLSLLVLTRPNLKGVMYVYLIGLSVSNLCVLITAVPALFDISQGFQGGSYTTAIYQAHFKIPLINSFMASSVYIIICMTINRYISIYMPTHFQRLHTFKNAQIHISLCFLAGVLLHIPLCFQNHVQCRLNQEEGRCSWQAREQPHISQSIMFKVYLVVSEILLRFGPITMLATLNTLIIYKFRKIAKRRQRLKGYSMQGIPVHRPSTPTFSNIPSMLTRDTELSNDGQLLELQDKQTKKIPQPHVLERQASQCSRRKSLQSPEERMLVLVLISIILLFVCCTTPAAILSIIFSVSLSNNLGFQIFRAVANNLELLNFALNFYIYCLCSAEIRRAFVSLFVQWAALLRIRQQDDQKRGVVKKQDGFEINDNDVKIDSTCDIDI